MRRVLVTGATGFVGRHTLPLLVGRGFQVHAVARKPPPVEDTGIIWHVADLLGGVPVLRNLLERSRPTHLLHLAWNVEHGRYWRSLENLRWVASSIELAREFALFGGKRIVAAGTCAEYDWSSGVCVEGTTPIAPAAPYGICKDGLRRLLQVLAAETDVEYAWARIFFVFGPSEHPARLVPSVIRALLSGQEAKTSLGRQIRDFLAVEDVAEALVAILESGVCGPVNIGSGAPIAVRDLVDELAQLIGGVSRVSCGAMDGVEEASSVVADVGRLRDEVGWKPGAPRSERLARLVERARRNEEWNT